MAVGNLAVFRVGALFRLLTSTTTTRMYLIWADWRTGIGALFCKCLICSRLFGDIAFRFFWLIFWTIFDSFPPNQDLPVTNYLPVLFTTNLLFFSPVSALIYGLFDNTALRLMFTALSHVTVPVSMGISSLHCLCRAIMH